MGLGHLTNHTLHEVMNYKDMGKKTSLHSWDPMEKGWSKGPKYSFWLKEGICVGRGLESHR